jgi:hypothetical protein
MTTKTPTPAEYHQFFKTTEYDATFVHVALENDAKIADILEALSRFLEGTPNKLKIAGCNILLEVIISKRRSDVDAYMKAVHNLETKNMAEKTLNSILGIAYDD